MANNVTETLLGAAVVVTAVGFVLFANQSGAIGSGGDGRYALNAKFNSAEGVSVGTDVRMAGVKIGTVTGLSLNTSSYQAEVDIAIRDDIAIPDDSDIKISSEGLLGGSFVELTPGGSEFMLAEGDEILYTQSAVSFINLLLKFVAGDGTE